MKATVISISAIGCIASTQLYAQNHSAAETLLEECLASESVSDAEGYITRIESLKESAEGMAASLEISAIANRCDEHRQAMVGDALRERRQQEETLAKQEEALAKEAERQELIRRQSVIEEAYEACLHLERRDEVSARTNPVCHELFLANKYR